MKGPARNEVRREEIIKVASRLISQKGYNGVSIQEIAKHVGIHKSTFFHYFENKENLLLAVLGRAIADVTTSLKEIMANDHLPPQEKLKVAIDNHMKLFLKYKDNVTIYHNDVQFLSDEKRKEYIKQRKYYAECFEQLVNEIRDENPEIFKALDSKIVTFGILGMCNWTIKWFSNSGRLSAEEIADNFYKMIIKEGDL